jgi:hypothetical protein
MLTLSGRVVCDINYKRQVTGCCIILALNSLGHWAS